MNYDFVIYFLIMLIIPMIANFDVKHTFKKYSKVGNYRRLTAEQVARMILDDNGLGNIKVDFQGGFLSDCYDPKSDTVILSNSTYNQISVAAIGVAAHECGHACQHASGYLPIKLRGVFVPVTNICSKLWYIVFWIGVLLSNMTVGTNLIYASVAMFAIVVLFQMITLPVELNASRRAMETLERYNILEAEELPMAKKVLKAAAMTYVASLFVSIVQLLRLVTLSRRR